MVLKRPIKTLPSTDAAGNQIDVAVSVVPMSSALIGRWASDIQPLIDNEYVHDASSAASGKPVRADVGWNWRLIYAYAAAHTVAIGGGSGPALAMAIVVQPSGASSFPIGMLTAVPDFTCTAFGTTRSRGFAWFLSDAPQEVYTRVLHQPAVRGVAKALIDCSIQATLDRSFDGTHLLHADPNGGTKLTNFYVVKCGMTQLLNSNGPVTPVWRRGHPDEYFHFDKSAALSFCSKYDPRR